MVVELAPPLPLPGAVVDVVDVVVELGPAPTEPPPVGTPVVLEPGADVGTVVDVDDVESPDGLVVVVVDVVDVVVVGGTVVVVVLTGMALGTNTSPFGVWITAPVPVDVLVSLFGGLKCNTMPRPTNAITISRVDRRIRRYRCTGADMNPTTALPVASSS